MNSTKRYYTTMKTRHVVYGALLMAALSWPWIWMATAGGEGDIVDLISLGILPAIIIGTFIMYRETKPFPASYRWAFIAALAAAFLLAWVIAAVGIYGRSGDPADLPYFGVLAVGVIGGLISHFQPRGMTLTLAAMAIAQLLVEVIGLIAELGSRLILNSFFAALWVGSALLFRYAAQDQSPSTERPEG